MLFRGFFASLWVDLFYNEIVHITLWWRQYDDDRYKPVLEQTHQWRVERLIGGPEARER